MLNFLSVLLFMIVVTYVLFCYHHSPVKTLSAARWMILAWTFLFLIHLASPVYFLSLTLSYATIIYCLVWIVIFCVGDNFGYRFVCLNKIRKCSKIQLTKRKIIALVICAFTGMLGLAYCSLGSVNMTSLLADLRDTQIAGENAGVFKTISTFMACVGLVVFLISASVSVLKNNKLPRFSYIGLMSYLSVSVLTAGRPGIIIGVMSIYIVLFATIQLSVHKNTKIKSLIINSIIILVLCVVYVMFVVSTRTTSWTGGMDNKISFINRLLDSTLNDNFRESLRPIGAFGDMVIESFYYLSPQLYGLEHSIKYYDGNFGFGAVELPYFTRRIESLLQIDILEQIKNADKATFENWGIAPNFFRTAVHSTFIDFGFVFSLFFVFVCGIFAGRIRKIAVILKSPFYIAFQGLICAGSAWTIIFSPFVEQSWAFPMLFFVLIIISNYFLKPFFDVVTKSPIVQSPIVQRRY